MRDEAEIRLLVFRVADLTCAAEVTWVREVLPAQAATRVPGAAPAVTGLINVRGALLPLIDGRRALGRPPGEGASIVLVEVGSRTAGFAVDDVVDLVAVDRREWAEGGELPGVDPRLVRAVGRREGVTFAVLDFEALLTPLLDA